MIQGRQRKGKRAGATVVEFSMVIAPVLLLLFAIFEYGRFVMIQQVVENAAREGARLAVTANAADTNSFNYQTAATIKNLVTSALAGQDTALGGLTVQVYDADASGNNIGGWSNASFGNNIAIQIDATYTPLLPGFTLPVIKQWVGLFPSSVPIHAKSIMHTEAN